MKLILLIPLFALLLFLQATLTVTVGTAHLHPDLLLLFVLSVGVISGTGTALFWAAAAGVFLNFLSVAPLGAYLVALLPATALTLVRELRLLESRFMLTLALSLVATFVLDIAMLTVLWTAGYRVEWLPSLFLITLPRAILNLAAAPVVYALVFRLLKLVGSRQPAFSGV